MIDKAPTIVLYGMWLVLSEEQFSGFDTAVGDVIDVFPPELLELCNAESRPLFPKEFAARSRTSVAGAPLIACGTRTHEELLCAILTFGLDGAAMQKLKEGLEAGTKVLDIWMPWIPKDFKLTIAGVVVGGGGAGTGVENPAKAFVENIKTVLEVAQISVDQVIGLQTQCRADEAAIESDLRSCSPPRTIFLATLVPRRPPTLRGISRLLDVWIKDAENVGIDVTEEEACELNPKNPSEAAEAYGLLCEAYDVLIPFEPPD